VKMLAHHLTQLGRDVLGLAGNAAHTANQTVLIAAPGCRRVVSVWEKSRRTSETGPPFAGTHSVCSAPSAPVDPRAASGAQDPFNRFDFFVHLSYSTCHRVSKVYAAVNLPEMTLLGEINPQISRHISQRGEPS
jgi:hypothetical protein